MAPDHIPPRGMWQVRRLTCATSCTRRTTTRRLLAVALEHALLVSLRERPATGIELTRRFDRSIGFFWRATHQQIYKVLRRMEGDGWVTATAGDARSTERRYAATKAGERVLADWIGSPTPAAAMRSDLAVKLRGASYGDRAKLLGHLDGPRRGAPHPAGALRAARARAVPRHATALTGHDLDTWLVLRGGIKQEQFWIEWLTEYTAGPRKATMNLPPPPRADHDRRPHPAQPGGDGLDAHRARGLRLGRAQARGVLRRTRPRRRGPDRHRRLRAQQARLAEAVRERADHPDAGRAAQAGHRRGARRGRRDRAPGAARRALRLHPVLAERQRPQVADHAVPAERDVHPRGRQDRDGVRAQRRASRSGRGTTRSRSWARRDT